jgi:hypothetical protein
LERGFDAETGRMAINVVDADTVTARLYEASALARVLEAF